MSAADHTFPRAVRCDGEDVEFRLMSAEDEAAVLAFARALPEHDRMFLRRDISEPKVVAAWIRELASGTIWSVLACRGGEVVGCAATVRDGLSWSHHVAELRVVLAERVRGLGLGQLLTQEAFAHALTDGAEKIVAQMTLDQKGARAMFEGLGFSIEAVLRDHVKDRAGRKHDVLILSHDVARVQERHAAYGVAEALRAPEQ